MSHITKYKINMMSMEALKKALKAMGFNAVEGKLKGYGSTTSKTDIIIKEHPSLGFLKNEDGSINFVGDFYSTGLQEKDFMNRLKSEYTYAELKRSMQSNPNIKIVKESRNGSKINVRCSYQ